MVDLKPQSFRVIESGGQAAEQDEPPTENVGEFLREARETTGRSLADVAASLRIRGKFLRSIEDGRYEDLPGPTYAVGFIRSYADYLGLDTAALLEQFKVESSSAERHPDLEFPAPSTVGWFPTGKVVASCAALAAAVFAGWFYLQTENSVDVTAVPAPPGIISDAVEKVTGKEMATPVNNVNGAATNSEIDDGVAMVDQAGVATAQPAAAEADTPPATTGETATNDGDQPYLLPLPITALVLPDPVATESDLQQPKPVETVRETPTPATAEPASAPAELVEQPAIDENEVTPVSVSAAAPAVPEPATQLAALPSIAVDDGQTDTSGDGRIFGDLDKEARVVIGARADSWVQVLDSDQNVLLTRMLRPGDRYHVPTRNDLVMLTGNAGGLIISVDGEPVPQIGSDGAILHNVRLDVELLKAGRAVIQ